MGYVDPDHAVQGKSGSMKGLLQRAIDAALSEEGPTATEYATMLALLTLALVTAFGPLRDGWIAVYSAIGNAVGS